jgi:hypothetical protein
VIAKTPWVRKKSDITVRMRAMIGVDPMIQAIARSVMRTSGSTMSAPTTSEPVSVARTIPSRSREGFLKVLNRIHYEVDTIGGVICRR